MYGSRGGSHRNTDVVPCQWFITLCRRCLCHLKVLIGMTGKVKSVASQKIQTNQSSFSGLREIRLLLSLVSENLQGQQSMSVDVCQGIFDLRSQLVWEIWELVMDLYKVWQAALWVSPHYVAYAQGFSRDDTLSRRAHCQICVMSVCEVGIFC